MQSQLKAITPLSGEATAIHNTNFLSTLIYGGVYHVLGK